MPNPLTTDRLRLLVKASKSDATAAHELAEFVEAEVRVAVGSMAKRYGEAARRTGLNLNDRNVRDDVIQGMLRRFFAAPEKFIPDRASFHTYMYSAVRFEVLSLMTRAQRRNRREGRPVTDLALFEKDEAPLDDFRSQYVSPAEEASQRDMLNLIRRKLALLPERLQRTVELRFFENMSIAEVASTLGEKESAIKMRLQRAMIRLREVMAKEIEAQRP